MSEFIAVATQRGGDGRVQEALVSFGADEIAVVCSRIGDAWEPRFALKNEEVVGLPSCFSLNEEATAELNRLIESESNNDDGGSR